MTKRRKSLLSITCSPVRENSSRASGYFSGSGLWRRSSQEVIKYVHEVDAPKPVKLYYEKIIPMSYRWGLFNIFYPFKWLLQFFVGLARPITRKPLSKRDLQEVAIKSTPCTKNFVLALQAEGYSTCMMEGLDEWRVKGLLGAWCSSRIVMADWNW